MFSQNITKYLSRLNLCWAENSDSCTYLSEDIYKLSQISDGGTGKKRKRKFRVEIEKKTVIKTKTIKRPFQVLGKHINICFAENPNFPDSFWSHVKSKSEKLRERSSKDASWGKLDTSEHSRSSGLQSGKSRRRAAIKRFSTLLAFFVFSEVGVFIWHFPTDCVNTTQSKSTLPQTQRKTHTPRNLTWLESYIGFEAVSLVGSSSIILLFWAAHGDAFAPGSAVLWTHWVLLPKLSF